MNRKQKVKRKTKTKNCSKIVQNSKGLSHPISTEEKSNPSMKESHFLKISAKPFHNVTVAKSIFITLAA